MSQSLAECYLTTRRQSVQFCEPLANEDYGLQAAEFVSPPKWHLAHTTWFFETFILKPLAADYQPLDPRYEYLFNSYYNGVGPQFPRAQRGLLSRPTVKEVIDYRQHVDDAILRLLRDPALAEGETLRQRCVLGIEHEMQHQELFFTDLKYSLFINPLYPAYSSTHDRVKTSTDPATAALAWLEFPGGLHEIGHAGDRFAFDNETPRHKVYVEPYLLANRLVTNDEYQAFIDDGGYERPELWLADGWQTRQRHDWQAPHYWLQQDGEPLEFTLHGLRRRDPRQPVCHISGYEADAYARWVDARLPTEQEWELSAATLSQKQALTGRGPACGYVHPTAAIAADGLLQLYSDCWQWTQSAYSPYPGFRAAAGAIGEYNGKFMSNQWVLRGGSCVSQPAQLRPSYRNFFYPADRWQFSGLRLAKTPG